jgi:hypothetical protein
MSDRALGRWLVTVGLVALPFIAAACRDIDVVTASYATIAEAAAEGAVARGWVPQGLPPGTREIREAHDLDSSRRWGLFNFPPAEAPAFQALLGPELSLDGTRVDPPRRIEWWPVLLRGPLKQEQVQATGARAYSAKSGDLVFLINWKQGRAYYWTR